MKIKFLKQKNLDFLKANVETYYDKYVNETTCDWVNNLEDFDDAFVEHNSISLPDDFEFDMTAPNNPSSTEIENIKIFYSALKDLSNSEATDERLWVGLSHSEVCWPYLRYRVINKLITDDKKSKENIKESIKSNYFFKQSAKRSLIVNTLSRLWWIGRLTYDENAPAGEEFESLAGIEYDTSTKILSIFSSNFTNNPKIVRAFLKGIIQIESENKQKLIDDGKTDIKETDYRVQRKINDNDIKVSSVNYLELIKYFNSLGGILILDYLEEDELKEKLVTYYRELEKDAKEIIEARLKDAEDAV